MFTFKNVGIDIKRKCVGNCGTRNKKVYLQIMVCVCLLKGEMVRQARVLAQATSDLVNAMRSDAEAEVDVDNSKKLLAAAKLLADATARMVEAAKVEHYILSPQSNIIIKSFNQLSCLAFDWRSGRT